MQLTPRLLSGTFRNFQLLKLKYDRLLSDFAASTVNLRRYNPEGMDEEADAADGSGSGSGSGSGCGSDRDGHVPGSCKHLLWQGVRASSAAPYYLADFSMVGQCRCRCRFTPG